MGISESTVKSFVQQFFVKTGARSRAQLVAAAIEHYWDQLDQSYTEQRAENSPYQSGADNLFRMRHVLSCEVHVHLLEPEQVEVVDRERRHPAQ